MTFPYTFIAQPEEQRSRNVAVFNVSCEVLRRLMNLPDGVTITAIRNSSEITGEFQFQVEGESVPESIEGYSIARVRPRFGYQELPCGCRETKFEGW